MIRGSFRGFISGWPGVIMITIALLAIVTCFCCWCASIFYGRSKRRPSTSSDDPEMDMGPTTTRSPHSSRNKSSSCAETMKEPNEQEMQYIGRGSLASEPEWTPRTIPMDGTCPYPTDPSLDGMPRPGPPNTN